MQNKAVKSLHHAALAAMLIIAVVGNTLLFARGLGEKSLIYDARPYLCALPFGLTFFLYCGFEAISTRFIEKSARYDLFAFPQNKHNVTVLISLVASMVLTAAGIIAAVNIDGAGEAVWACVAATGGSALSSLVYLGLSLFQAIKAKKGWKEYLILSSFIFGALLAEILPMALTLGVAIDCGFLYVLLPIHAISMIFVTRGE